jgi:hypothetical protein
LQENRMFFRHISQRVEKVIHFQRVDVDETGEGGITEETPLQHADKKYGHSKVGVELSCPKHFERGPSDVILWEAIVDGLHCKLLSVGFGE